MKAKRFFVGSQGIVLALAVLMFSTTGFGFRVQAGSPTAEQLELPQGAMAPALPIATNDKAMAIAAGGNHTCALTSSGGVKCWGENETGQLGDGTTTRRTIPVSVSLLTSGVSAVAAGTYHTCALTNSSGVMCWGYNGDGELGDGTQENRNTPVYVSGLTGGVTAIATGRYHTCALSAGGSNAGGIMNLASSATAPPMNNTPLST